MIQIITGDDEYQIHQKLQNIKNKFIEKTGSDFGIIKFEAKNTNFNQIRQSIISFNFFQNYKLIIINDFLNLNPTDLEKLFIFSKNIKSEVILILVQSIKADKRKLNKWTKQYKNIELNKLSYLQIENWIKKKVEKEKGKIDFLALKKLSQYVGDDLFRMEQEINKLIAYKNKKEINENDVEKLVWPSINPSIFHLIDAISQKDVKKSLNELFDLFNAGEHELYILTMIIYGFRNLILIKYLNSKGNSAKDIASKLKIHPFVVQKTLSQINKFQMSQLAIIYQKLFDAEFSIKSGKKDGKFVLEMLVSFLARM